VVFCALPFFDYFQLYLKFEPLFLFNVSLASTLFRASFSSIMQEFGGRLVLTSPHALETGRIFPFFFPLSPAFF